MLNYQTISNDDVWKYGCVETAHSAVIPEGCSRESIDVKTPLNKEDI
jgi:hypothetical protein